MPKIFCWPRAFQIPGFPIDCHSSPKSFLKEEVSLVKTIKYAIVSTGKAQEIKFIRTSLTDHPRLSASEYSR